MGQVRTEGGRIVTPGLVFLMILAAGAGLALAIVIVGMAVLAVYFMYLVTLGLVSGRRGRS